MAEKYIIKSKDSELYYFGGSSFVRSIKEAKVFHSLDEIHPHFKNSLDEEIIELNGKGKIKKTKKQEKLCIIKSKEYKNNTYYYGDAAYGSDLFRGIHDYNKLKDFEKDGHSNEIIFVDSREGIEIIVDEIHKLQDYVEHNESRLNEKKEGLNFLYDLPHIQKYVKAFNNINPFLREENYENKQWAINKALKD